LGKYERAGGRSRLGGNKENRNHRSEGEGQEKEKKKSYIHWEKERRLTFEKVCPKNGAIDEGKRRGKEHGCSGKTSKGGKKKKSNQHGPQRNKFEERGPFWRPTAKHVKGGGGEVQSNLKYSTAKESSLLEVRNLRKSVESPWWLGRKTAEWQSNKRMDKRGERVTTREKKAWARKEG